MIELPGSLKEVLIERIDEQIDAKGASAPKQWFEALLVGLEAAAEELDEDLGENLVSKLEDSGELEQSLSKELQEQFEGLTDITGEEIIRILNSVCEVAWIDEDGDDEIAKGFMESDGYEDDDEEEEDY
tara:strand:- start:302 stop:688 length:387 start_codon:yes stop_codon:yes gene_type:complete